MYRYKVGRICLGSDREISHFDSFLASETQSIDVKLYFDGAAEDSAPSAVRVCDCSYFSVKQTTADDWLFEHVVDESKLLVSQDYSQAHLSSNSNVINDCAVDLVRLLLQCNLILCGCLTLHAACVAQDGKAYAFTARSGVGKSTRAGRWIEALGSEWVSGDRPCIDVANGLVFGAPWDGKEQIFNPIELPLGCIVEVRRAPFTRLRTLDARQSETCLAHQTFFPLWDPMLSAKVMVLLKSFIQGQRVTRLFCDQDSDAAYDAYKLLLAGSEAMLGEADDMKMNDGFIIRKELGEFMLMPTGDNLASFPGLVVLNEVGAFILENMRDPICHEDMVSLIASEYDVDCDVARNDLDAFLGRMEKLGVVSL